MIRCIGRQDESARGQLLMERDGTIPLSGIVACVRPILRRLVVVAALLLLLPAGARAAGLQADLDGDGIRDLVFPGPHPNDLCVVLSRTPLPQRFRLPEQVVDVTTADIDHDGDRDIIATTAQAGLDIFLNMGRGRFRVIHAPVVRHWQTGPRLGAGPVHPQTDNLSDAQTGSPAVRRVPLRGLSPTRLVRLISHTFAARPLPRGIDLRGPPPRSV